MQGGDGFLSNTYYATGDTIPGYTAAYMARDRTAYAFCFLEGVLIGAPGGPVPVETLKIGDLISTADGRDVAVKWIGRQTVIRRFNPAVERTAILIRAGALAPLMGGAFLPERDLRLTADHALQIDGLLIQAGALVNGADIRPLTAAETGETYLVWHIETEAHEIVLAEGCPAETFIDNVARRRFDNYAEYEALFGPEDHRAIPELDLPRVMAPRQLPMHLRALMAPRQAA